MGDDMATDREKFENLLEKVATQQKTIDDITDVVCQLRDEVDALTKRSALQEETLQTIQQHHRAQLMGLFGRLGESFTDQAKRLQEPVQYTTTLRRIPEDEAENDVSVFVRLQNDTPMVFKQNDEGDLVKLTDARLDMDKIYAFLIDQTNPGGLHHVNLYIEQL